MWSIALIDNTVAIDAKCAEALYDQYGGLADWDEDDLAYLKEGGRLYFNSDHYEHMDYVGHSVVLAVLKEHKVNGDITFGSLEGDNAGRFWGYRFKNGNLTRLKGTVTFQEAVRAKNA
jgi:hypothetical protein